MSHFEKEETGGERTRFLSMWPEAELGHVCTLVPFTEA